MWWGNCERLLLRAVALRMPSCAPDAFTVFRFIINSVKPIPSIRSLGKIAESFGPRDMTA